MKDIKVDNILVGILILLISYLVPTYIEYIQSFINMLLEYYSVYPVRIAILVGWFMLSLVSLYVALLEVAENKIYLNAVLHSILITIQYLLVWFIVAYSITTPVVYILLLLFNIHAMIELLKYNKGVKHE